MSDRLAHNLDRQTALYEKAAALITDARQQVRVSVNRAMVLTYWQIGQWIVEGRFELDSLPTAAKGGKRGGEAAVYE